MGKLFFRHVKCIQWHKTRGCFIAHLFIAYFNDSFKRLRHSQLGCHIGNMYVGALGYADDRYADNFCVAFNSWMSIFGNLKCKLKYRLFKTYCMPLYGLVL